MTKPRSRAAAPEPDAGPTDGNGEARRLFHRTAGGIDFARLLEQLIPSIIIGLIVIYANSLVMQNQVSELKLRQDRIEDKVTSQNEKLIALNAQVAAYLGQQTQLNAAVDARMTYLERDKVRGNR